MFDYYSHVYSMTEEKLVDEIHSLNKKLMKVNQTSPVYNQLLDMLNTAEQAYNDILYGRMIKKEDAVINIGEIESVETKPDYDRDDILTALVQEYTKDFKR